MYIPAQSMRTTTVESLLGLLSVKPQTGYELKKYIERSTGNFWRESFGQIYPTLKRMVADGLAEVSEDVGGGRRERKVYKLTEAGRGRLREWLALPAAEQVPRNELLLKLFFGDRGEREDMRRLVQTKREQLTANLTRYEAIEKRISAEAAGHPGLPYWLITVRYGKAEAAGLLAWCDESLAAIEGIGNRE